MEHTITIDEIGNRIKSTYDMWTESKFHELDKLQNKIDNVKRQISTLFKLQIDLNYYKGIGGYTSNDLYREFTLSIVVGNERLGVYNERDFSFDKLKGIVENFMIDKFTNGIYEFDDDGEFLRYAEFICNYDGNRCIGPKEYFSFDKSYNHSKIL